MIDAVEFEGHSLGGGHYYCLEGAGCAGVCRPRVRMVEVFVGILVVVKDSAWMRWRVIDMNNGIVYLRECKERRDESRVCRSTSHAD